MATTILTSATRAVAYQPRLYPTEGEALDKLLALANRVQSELVRYPRRDAVGRAAPAPVSRDFAGLPARVQTFEAFKKGGNRLARASREYVRS
jgi:hypothetical protein